MIPFAQPVGMVSPKHARKLQVPKVHTLCSQLFIFKLLNFSHHIQCGTKIFWLLLVAFNNWINFRLKYLIHSKTELNMRIYNLHPQRKENTLQSLSVWFYQRCLNSAQRFTGKFFFSQHLRTSFVCFNMEMSWWSNNYWYS